MALQNGVDFWSSRFKISHGLILGIISLLMAKDGKKIMNEKKNPEN